MVEDDPAIASEIQAALQRLGYGVGHAADGLAGIDMACAGTWDALVVDRMLPGLDGLALIRALRARGNTAPVLVLSALDHVRERINGLRAGGDDYLVKPFALDELTARLEALIRRPAGAAPTLLRLGELELDLLARTARCGPSVLDLLGREFQLLEYFLRRPGQVVTRQMLLTDVFGYRFELRSNLVDVHVGRLRRKLEEAAGRPLIETLRGTGFRLVADD